MQTMAVGATVYNDIVVTDSDAGMAGDVMVSCDSSSSTVEVYRSVLSLIFPPADDCQFA